MKKKHRDITVGGQKFGWTVNYMGRTVTIWEGKRPILETTVETTSDNYHTITPKQIKALIVEKIINT